jgi:hypothetical protein
VWADPDWSDPVYAAGEITGLHRQPIRLVVLASMQKLVNPVAQLKQTNLSRSQKHLPVRTGTAR